ncbi:hypothetical protein BT69DRAFT_1155029 [Atractiella rhizophila]|nr:hypothetical protein BT69DRAFT_1155029 [Atractiella rhizophila]
MGQSPTTREERPSLLTGSSDKKRRRSFQELSRRPEKQAKTDSYRPRYDLKSRRTVSHPASHHDADHKSRRSARDGSEDSRLMPTAPRKIYGERSCSKSRGRSSSPACSRRSQSRQLSSSPPRVPADTVVPAGEREAVVRDSVDTSMVQQEAKPLTLSIRGSAKATTQKIEDVSASRLRHGRSRLFAALQLTESKPRGPPSRIIDAEETRRLIERPRVTADSLHSPSHSDRPPPVKFSDEARAQLMKRLEEEKVKSVREAEEMMVPVLPPVDATALYAERALKNALKRRGKTLTFSAQQNRMEGMDRQNLTENTTSTNGVDFEEGPTENYDNITAPCQPENNQEATLRAQLLRRMQASNNRGKSEASTVLTLKERLKLEKEKMRDNKSGAR